MKFQNPSMLGSEVMLCIKKHNARTHEPEAICPSNFFEVGGIKTSIYMVFSNELFWHCNQYKSLLPYFSYVWR